MLTVGYVGQHGTHLVVAMPYFQKQLVNGQILPSPYLGGNPTLTQQDHARFPAPAPAPTRSTTRCRPRCASASAWACSITLAYTWQKGMSDSIGYYGEGGQAGGQSAYMQNLYDRKAEWGPTYFDVTHNFVGSFVYETPFGHKQEVRRRTGTRSSMASSAVGSSAASTPRTAASR